MPVLDVSEALNEPDFQDTFSVQRRTETVGLNGRAERVAQTFSNIQGVVTQGSPKEIYRREDGSLPSSTIIIFTQFRLQNNAGGLASDVVAWSGNYYVVTSLEDWSLCGAGFVRATCHSWATQPAAIA